jgi:hypothetical protein
VTIALAVGTKVVAYGRGELMLKRMKQVLDRTGRIQTAILTGEVEKDAQSGKMKRMFTSTSSLLKL